MINRLSERAVAEAYIANREGTVVVDFQFAPGDLAFADRERFYSRMRIGHHRPEMVWIWGESKEIELRFFIDRTYGSKGKQDLGVAPETLPAFRQPAGMQGLTQREQAELQESRVRRFSEGDFRRFMSEYRPSPNFLQFAEDEERGVYMDFMRLRYFLSVNTPKVLKEDLEKGTIRYEDRFVPPPKAYLVYGNLWMGGYITEIQYMFSEMNKKLVPKRLDAMVRFSVIEDGLLTGVNGSTVKREVVL